MRPGKSDRRREKETYVASKAIVGEKVGMTQVWDDQNRAVPVTVLKVAPVRVVQVKTPETDGYAALQVTWGFRRNSTLTKPQLGHYAKAGVNPGRALVELRLDDVADYTVGQELAADLWEAGERVDAIAVSKGKGFAGGMKRHNFKGQGASHGNHRSHRVPGAIGACATPSRVFKGTRMAGQMGGTQVTALNLEVVSADAERELVLVKGAVPGARGSVVVLRNSVKAPTKAGGSR
jgi:large subunit ribosomal protein L3